MSDQSYGNCRFWMKLTQNRFAGLGKCRRFPPVPISPNHESLGLPVSEYPVIAKSGWCGEWKPLSTDVRTDNH